MLQHARADIIHYQQNWTFEAIQGFGDPAGLDGSTIQIDTLFDASQVWQEMFKNQVSVIPSSVIATVSGSSVAANNGSYVLANSFYLTAIDPGFGNGLTTFQAADELVLGDGSSLGVGLFADQGFFVSLNVPAHESGVLPGSPLALENFVPAVLFDTDGFFYGTQPGSGVYGIQEGSFTVSAVKIPEPSSTIIGLVGLIGLIGRRRR